MAHTYNPHIMAKKKSKKPQPQAPITPEKYLREKVRSLPIGKSLRVG